MFCLDVVVDGEELLVKNVNLIVNVSMLPALNHTADVIVSRTGSVNIVISVGPFIFSLAKYQHTSWTQEAFPVESN